MRYLFAMILLLGVFNVDLKAHATSVENIKTLLTFGEKDEDLLILSILVDCEFNKLLGGCVPLSELADGMKLNLDIVNNPSVIPVEMRKDVFPNKRIKKMYAALDNLKKADESCNVSWQQATRQSFEHGKYTKLAQATKKLSDAGIKLPLVFLHARHLPDVPGDGRYFFPNLYLDRADWSEHFGDWTYFELVTTEVCAPPCDPGRAPDKKEECIQEAIQLGILRVMNDGFSFLGNDCCKMPARKCYAEPDLGCTQGANGYCTFASIYCP